MIIRLPRKQRLMGLALDAVSSLWNSLRSQSPPGQQVTKVVIIEPFGLGDVITHEPLVSALLSAGVRVVFCGSAHWRPVLPAHPLLEWVDAAFPWTSYSEQSKYSLARYRHPSFQACFDLLRRHSQDAVWLDTRGDSRTVLLAQWLGARSLLSLTHYIATDLEHIGTVPRVKRDVQLERWEQNLAFIEALGLPATAARPPQLPHLQGTSAAASPVIGLLPIAPWPGKYWPETRWQDLAAALTAAGKKPIIVCGPGQEYTAGAVVPGIEVRGVKSIAEWGAVLSELGALVTVDSGPMHLAAAIGKPLVAIAGNAVLPLWAAPGPLSKVLSKATPEEVALCHPVDAAVPIARAVLAKITVEDVLQALRELRVL